MPCTIGAKILRPGAEYVLFKNKDLMWKSFTDQLVIKDTVFGIMGVHIPTQGVSQELRSGFSIGANAAGVCACNSHVRSVEGGENYDLLTEAAVRGTKNGAEACEAVIAGARSARYNWSNILVAGPDGVAVIEIADDAASARNPLLITRANEHLLSHSGRESSSPSARGRRADALVSAATGVEDILSLCRSHEGTADKSNICAHGAPHGRSGWTVYSYILHWHSGGFTLLVRQGRPCEGDYIRIPLRFPVDPRELRAAYPAA
jgi:hypothetical protein